MTAVPSVAQLLALADKAQDRPLTPAEAGRLRTGIRALATHPSQTCDASVIGLMGAPVGPCVLRYQHDGPVCQAADGTRWARTAAVRPPDGLNPYAANDAGPENGAQTGTRGSATLTVVVTAPTQENADHWAATLRDLIAAEHGEEMRLHMTIGPADTTEETR